jgi:hypothetical protein
MAHYESATHQPGDDHPTHDHRVGRKGTRREEEESVVAVR